MTKIKSNMTLISSRKKERMKLSMPGGKQRIKNVVSVLWSPKRDWKNQEPKSSWPAGLSLVLPCSSLSPPMTQRDGSRCKSLSGRPEQKRVGPLSILAMQGPLLQKRAEPETKHVPTGCWLLPIDLYLSWGKGDVQTALTMFNFTGCDPSIYWTPNVSEALPGTHTGSPFPLLALLRLNLPSSYSFFFRRTYNLLMTLMTAKLPPSPTPQSRALALTFPLSPLSLPHPFLFNQGGNLSFFFFTPLAIFLLLLPAQLSTAFHHFYWLSPRSQKSNSGPSPSLSSCDC